MVIHIVGCSYFLQKMSKIGKRLLKQKHERNGVKWLGLPREAGLLGKTHLDPNVV
jgi:hypothetical protein